MIKFQIISIIVLGRPLYIPFFRHPAFKNIFSPFQCCRWNWLMTSWSKLGGARDKRAACVGSLDTNCDIDKITSDIATRCVRKTKRKKKISGEVKKSFYNKIVEQIPTKWSKLSLQLIHAEQSNAHLQPDELPRSGRINILLTPATRGSNKSFDTCECAMNNFSKLVKADVEVDYPLEMFFSLYIKFHFASYIICARYINTKTKRETSGKKANNSKLGRIASLKLCDRSFLRI